MAVTQEEVKGQADYITQRTILLYERDGDHYKPKGSGVVMEFLDVHFILTASHVIIDNLPLYIYSRVVGMHQIDEFYREAIDYKLEENHNQDVGFIILNPETRLILSFEYKFDHAQTNLMIHDMVHDVVPYQLYHIVGYPEKVNRIIGLNEEVERISPAILTSAPIRNAAKVFQYYKFNPIAHYIMQAKGSADSFYHGEGEPKKREIPSLNGMSGGGIWLMATWQGKPLPVLIGIFTEIRTGKYQSYIGCKINIPLKRIIALEQMGLFGQPIDLEKPKK